MHLRLAFPSAVLLASSFCVCLLLLPLAVPYYLSRANLSASQCSFKASTAICEPQQTHGWKPAPITALSCISNESEMQQALGPNGVLDSWLVKGGKSLRVILDEIAAQQKELDENGHLTSPRL
jgi:hypothetical protein